MAAVGAVILPSAGEAANLAASSYLEAVKTAAAAKLRQRPQGAWASGRLSVQFSNDLGRCSSSGSGNAAAEAALPPQNEVPAAQLAAELAQAVPQALLLGVDLAAP